MGGGRGGPGRFFRLRFQTFSTIFSADFMGGRGGNRQRAARGSDLRYKPARVAARGVFRGSENHQRADLGPLCGPMSMARAPRPGPSRPPARPARAWVRCAPNRVFFKVERTCPTCSGRGQMIKNPCTNCGGAGPGETRERAPERQHPCRGRDWARAFALAGEGEAGLRGGPTGDLYIFIEVAPHALFERDGRDLYCRVPVSMASALAWRRTSKFPTIDGGRSRVKIPSGSQSGRQMRLRGKGMPALRGGRCAGRHVHRDGG